LSGYARLATSCGESVGPLSGETQVRPLARQEIPTEYQRVERKLSTEDEEDMRLVDEGCAEVCPNEVGSVKSL
jgi:hypothetical protein